MHVATFDGSYDEWAAAARACLRAGMPPEQIEWVDRSEPGSADTLFVAEEHSAGEPATAAPDGAAVSEIRVPRGFLESAKFAACHRDPKRWSLLYRLLWRLTHGEPHLLDVVVDPDVRELHVMEKELRHDVHKMRAFVRFREVETNDGPWFVAWFEPQHHIVERNAEFFRDRFASMRWSILTPDRCVHWDGKELQFTEGVDRSQAPAEDAMEDLWRTYYGSIFNPARVKVQAMTSEMPRHYWKNLPETRIIPELLQRAPVRVEEMHAASKQKKPVTEFVPYEVPQTRDLNVLREAVQGCRGCPLWKNATCAVFGEGPKSADVLVVGEQPGDQEDRAGKPFIGPAGQLLNRAFEAAGIERDRLYVTNAVKHFKWTPQGKRRLHAKPSPREIAACRPWLQAEVGLVKPKQIVCLGSTAAGSVVGPEVRVTQQRGEELETEFGVGALITLHPSALLRLPDRSRADEEFDRFVADLRKIRASK